MVCEESWMLCHYDKPWPTSRVKRGYFKQHITELVTTHSHQSFAEVKKRVSKCWVKLYQTGKDQNLFSSIGWKGVRETKVFGWSVCERPKTVCEGPKFVLKCWVEGSGRDGRPVTATSLRPPPLNQPSATQQPPPLTNHTTKTPTGRFCS